MSGGAKGLMGLWTRSWGARGVPPHMGVSTEPPTRTA